MDLEIKKIIDLHKIDLEILEINDGKGSLPNIILKQQQQILFYLLGGLTIISLIFSNCFCQKRITESGIGLLIGMIKKGPELVP